MQKEWLKRLLLKIAREELVEGVKEILEIKTVDKDNRIFRIVVRVKDTEGEYIVRAIVQITLTHKEDSWWKLIDLSWEEVR
jgi:uncharacterized phage-associated protein